MLAWLAVGYRDWHEHGLRDPEQVIKATQAYRAESDALGRFLAERCMDHGNVGSTELHKAWESWALDEGEEPISQTAMAKALQDKGYENYTVNGRRRWRGLGLIGSSPTAKSRVR